MYEQIIDNIVKFAKRERQIKYASRNVFRKIFLSVFGIYDR